MISKPVDYLKKARELGARRGKGGAPAPTPPASSPPQDVGRAKAPDPVPPESSGFKGTRKYALITERDQLAVLAALLADTSEVALDIETYP